MATTKLIVGCYSQDLGFVQGKGKGAYIFNLNTATGDLAFEKILECGENPTYICVDQKTKVFHVCTELYQVDSQIHTFSIQDFKLLGTVQARGTACCHDVVEPTTNTLWAANYMSGSVIGFTIAADGSLVQPAIDFSEFPVAEASGADPSRQERPHAHQLVIQTVMDGLALASLTHCMQVVFHPTSPKFLFVPDLGSDLVRVLVFDGTKLTAQPSIALPPGSGPRHMVIHPLLSFLYVVNELSNTVSVVSFDTATAQFNLLQTISTLPAGFSGTSYCAAIRLSTDLKHVYVSNRIHDSIAIFSVEESGLLVLRACEPCQGLCPRDIIIVDNCLIAANQGKTIDCPTPAVICPLPL